SPAMLVHLPGACATSPGMHAVEPHGLLPQSHAGKHASAAIHTDNPSRFIARRTRRSGATISSTTSAISAPFAAPPRLESQPQPVAPAWPWNGAVFASAVLLATPIGS